MENLKSVILEFSRSIALKAKFQNITPIPNVSKTEIEPICSKNLPFEDNKVQSVLDLLPDKDPELITVFFDLINLISFHVYKKNYFF